MNKSEFIRRYPKATASELVKMAKGSGIKLTSQAVYNVRSADKVKSMAPLLTGPMNPIHVPIGGEAKAGRSIVAASGTGDTFAFTPDVSDTYLVRLSAKYDGGKWVVTRSGVPVIGTEFSLPTSREIDEQAFVRLVGILGTREAERLIAKVREALAA